MSFRQFIDSVLAGLGASRAPTLPPPCVHLDCVEVSAADFGHFPSHDRLVCRPDAALLAARLLLSGGREGIRDAVVVELGADSGMVPSFERLAAGAAAGSLRVLVWRDSGGASSIHDRPVVTIRRHRE